MKLRRYLLPVLFLLCLQTMTAQRTTDHKVKKKETSSKKAPLALSSSFMGQYRNESRKN